MAYYFNKGEYIDIAVKRILFEQTDKAVSGFQEMDNVHKVIHDIRKRCKKIRALLRLVRDDIGNSEYRERNVFYRDTARRLSDLRDAITTRKALDNLATMYKGVIPEDTMQYLREWLEIKKVRLTAKRLIKDNVVEKVIRTLEESKAYISDLPVSDSLTFEVIAPSLSRVYERGYIAFPLAYENDDAASFHEFRKRVKYLWYQTRLLKQMWPNVLNELASEIHKLSEWLGDDHDLMVLKSMLENAPFIDDRNRKTTLRLIEKESNILRERSLSLAELIYAENPKRFVRRMNKYWNAWQDREPTFGEDLVRV
jgi:CHAD domain-containing protein